MKAGGQASRRKPRATLGTKAPRKSRPPAPQSAGAATHAMVAELRERLEAAEELLRAIRQGEVDGIVVEGPGNSEQVFTLKSAEHPYRVLVEAMNEGAATLLADGTVVYSNSQLALLLDLPHSEVLGASFTAFVHPDTAQEYQAMFDQAASGHPARGEIRLRSQDSAGIPAYLSLAKVDLEAMAPGISLLATDLREQKRSQEILNSERLTRSILDQTVDAIVVCDGNDRIIRANQAACALCGTNPLFQAFDQAFPVLFPDGTQMYLPNQVLGRERKLVQGIEASLERRDGARLHLLVSIGSLVSDDAFLGCVVSMTDITGRKRGEEELREAVRARDEFVSIASHELKTPITVMKMQTQLLMLGMRAENPAIFTPERFAKLVDQTDGQLSRLARLVDDMLDTSRISTGKFAIKPERVDLGELVSEVVERFTPQLASAGCKVTQEIAPEIVGEWDRLRIEQVVANLITNAIRYAPRAPVHITLTADSRHARLKVQDQGRGIAPENHERIFRRFERVVSANEVSGFGLGLAIVRQIVELHGGRIRVESDLGKGAAFIVELPLARH